MERKTTLALAALALCACTSKEITYTENTFFQDAFHIELPASEDPLCFDQETTSIGGQERKTPRTEIGTLYEDLPVTYTLKLYTAESTWELVPLESNLEEMDSDEAWEKSIQNEADRITETTAADIQSLEIDGQPSVLCLAITETGGKQFCLMIRSKDRKGCVFLQILNDQESYNKQLEAIIQHVIDTFHWND